MEDEPNSTKAELVINLRNDIITSCEEAKEALKDAGIETRYYANRKAKKIELSPNDKVLLLLPEKSDRLAVSWQGPFNITRKISDVDYEVKIKDKVKVFHINMLKPFVTHEQDSNVEKVTEGEPRYDTQIASSLITEKDADNLPTEIITVESKERASWEDCKMQEGLLYQVKQQITRLLK